jgi:hypothetical protein
VNADRGWSKVAIERLEQQAPGHFGYSLFSISRADLRRLRELYSEYRREMQAIIARSTRGDPTALRDVVYVVRS